VPFKLLIKLARALTTKPKLKPSEVSSKSCSERKSIQTMIPAYKKEFNLSTDKMILWKKFEPTKMKTKVSIMISNKKSEFSKNPKKLFPFSVSELII